MISVEDFMNQEGTPKQSKSKLEPYKKDIETLKKSGYTEDSILKFLVMNGVQVGKTTLHVFIKRHIEFKLDVEETDNINNDSFSKKNNSQGGLVVEIMQPAPKAFDWQTPIAKEDLF